MAHLECQLPRSKARGSTLFLWLHADHRLRRARPRKARVYYVHRDRGLLSPLHGIAMCTYVCLCQLEGRWVGREVWANQRNLDESVTFLKTSTPIWTAAVEKASLFNKLTGKEGEKLEGRHTFDFSVVLPETIDSSMGATYGVPTFPLPATFSEAGTRAGVFYKIAVVVARSQLSADES